MNLKTPNDMTPEEARAIIKANMKDMAKIVQDAIGVLHPELRESEDERIRKEIRNFLIDMECKKEWIAYLEKQKVIAAIPDEIVECYKNLCEIQDILINSEEDKQIDEITHDVRSLLDYPIKQKPVEWKPQPESLEALMYAIEGKWDMISPTSYLSRRLEDLYDGLVNTYNVDEPPLAKLPKTAYTAKDIEELRALKDKIEASMDEKPAEWSENHIADIFEKVGLAKIAREQGNDELTNALQDAMLELSKVKNIEWSDTDNIGWDEAFACVTRAEKSAKNEEELQNAVTAEKWLKEIKFKYCVHPVKQEWSDEDERIKSCICLALTDVNEQRFKGFGTTLKDCLAWVKDLHPSWKPSAEQMDALERTTNLSNFGLESNRRQILLSLYEQLKKLTQEG